MSTSNSRPRSSRFALAFLLLGAAAAAALPSDVATASIRPAGVPLASGTPRRDPVGLRPYRPYERGKVPVVLIHGLWGRPETWDPLVAALEADPAIRERFQFWAFAYPTGDPILDSAARLGAALRRARAEVDPSAEDAALDRPVLVGHSLGGLLAKAVGAGTEGPTAGRVVFIATPHRGSPLAVGLSGRLGVRLYLPGDFGPDRAGTGASSIEQLAIGHSVLRALEAADLGPAVPYHSIVADQGLPYLGRTDGIVPFASSHLDGADSELIVHGGHFCLNHPEVIREVGRILRLHAAPRTGASSSAMPIASMSRGANPGSAVDLTSAVRPHSKTPRS